MRAMLLIAWRGFVTHATSRAFLVGLMLMPLYMLIGGYAPQVSQLSGQASVLQQVRRHFAVIDQTGSFLPVIDAALVRDDATRGYKALLDYAEKNVDEERLRKSDATLAKLVLDGDADSPADVATFENLGGASGAFVALQPYLKPGAEVFTAPRARFIRVELPPDVASAEDPVAEAQPYLLGDDSIETPSGGLAKLWALLVLPKDFATGGTAIYTADDVVRTGLRDFLKEALTQELRKRRIEAAGLPADAVVTAMNMSAPVKTIDPDEQTKLTAPLQQFAMVGPMLVYLMLFLAVFMTANMVVTSMVEEKSNRVAELLLSCVRAETLMAGKLVAGLLLAFLLVAVWMISASASAAWLYPSSTSVVADFFSSITSGTQPVMMIVFFSLAYLTVASFYLAAGSAATSVSDAQAIVAPATLLTLPVFLVPVAIAFDPNGFLAQIASYIPLVSPFVMMLRSMSGPPPTDVLIAFAVSFVTLVFMIRLVARVFRANLLKPDSTPSFVSFIRDFFGARRAA